MRTLLRALMNGPATAADPSLAHHEASRSVLQNLKKPSRCRGGERLPRLAHNQVFPGSTPGPAPSYTPSLPRSHTRPDAAIGKRVALDERSELVRDRSRKDSRCGHPTSIEDASGAGSVPASAISTIH